MKVLGIVGSPRRNGNTEILMTHTLKAVMESGLDTELICLSGKDIRGCNACMACSKKEECSIEDDLFPIYLKMKEADGIILSSPVYFGSATAVIKGLMERTGYISRFHGEPFRGKVGGPLVVARRGGLNFTFSQLTLWYQVLGMVIPGSTSWNIAFGRNPGEVHSDEEGMRTAYNFGKNLAWVVKALALQPELQPDTKRVML
ncbi:MAG: flavodoxin family protein [Pseudomonadota bacterium]